MLGDIFATIVFNGASRNASQDDLALAPVSIALRGRVVADDVVGEPPTAVPAPASGTLMGLAAGALWWLRRRKVAAKDA